ncbi:MAG: hypothetical protein U0451_02595 [Candidatus Saccharimonadales bacterium]
MREHNKRRDNVRLVRLSNGQLVTEEQATNIVKLKEVSDKQNQLNREIKEKESQILSKEEKRKIHGNPKDKDILEIWKKQEEIKKERQRLEIEYELAKKMAKELKQKLKEQQVSIDSQFVDDAFGELLSPEAKGLTKKLKPLASKAKNHAKKSAGSAKLTVKKNIKLTRLIVKKHKRASVSVVLIILLIFAGGVGLIIKNSKNNIEVNEVQGAQSEKPKIQTSVTPDFATLVPKGKDIQELGGFARVSPENSAAAYAYRDSMNEIPIIVTQQKKPESLSDQLKIENLAKAYNATKQVQVDGTVIYLGKSEKGPQSAIFVKDDLLVLIKAEQEITDIYWVEYIGNLVKG